MLNASSQAISRNIDPTVLDNVRAHLASRVIGQRDLIDSMLICLLSQGHLLVEGMPGLAKTTAVKALAEAIEGNFHRIQFTPDLLPSDLIGTDIYRHEKGEFEFRPGPLFHNILLADEVNRAPAKVQSHCDLMFTHGLEQRGLNFCRRPVHLIGEQYIVKQWPGSKLEFTFFMAVNIGTYQIGRQQVRGELNTVKISFNGFGQSFYRRRLRQAGHTLYQEMTLAQEADEHAVDEFALPDNP